MKVIDARSGKELKLGDQVTYPPIYSWPLSTTKPDPDSYRLMNVVVGLFSADVTVRRVGGEVVTLKGAVRYLHPNFLLRRVVFVET
ncbi:MAG: hypothetical protein WC986_14725 [Elusimicrobiota bacterium]